MAVEDIAHSTDSMRVSRMTLAKSLIQDGISQRGWEHAILSYARDARVESPFSSDSEFLSKIVDGLSVVEFYGGSDIGSALTLADMLYGKWDAPVDIIFLTDGWTLPENLPLMSRVFDFSWIGIGSLIWGKIPLWYDINGDRRYKYYSWSEIVVRYDPRVLEKLQDTYGGDLIALDREDEQSNIVTQKPITPDIQEYILFIASLSLILGYLIHPYAKKK